MAVFTSTPLTITACRVPITKYAKSIGILLSMFSFFVHSATDNQIELIKMAAERHIRATVDQPSSGELVIDAAEIDSRIKATDCPTPLDTTASSVSNSRSNINVLVECPADNWKVYVPVRISLSVPMVVATRPLARGQMVSADDITMAMIELQRFRKDGFASNEQVIGAKIKRNVRLGDVVERNDVCVVCRNEKVSIKATKSGMTITTQGTALQDGTAGEQVRVKNDKSKRIIEGIVTDIAEITVNF